MLCVQADQLNNWSHISNAFQYQMTKFNLLMNPSDWPVIFGKVYDAFTRSENYQKQQYERHEKYGAYRSGEGTKAQI